MPFQGGPAHRALFLFCAPVDAEEEEYPPCPPAPPDPPPSTVFVRMKLSNPVKIPSLVSRFAVAVRCIVPPCSCCCCCSVRSLLPLVIPLPKLPADGCSRPHLIHSSLLSLPLSSLRQRVLPSNPLPFTIAYYSHHSLSRSRSLLNSHLVSHRSHVEIEVNSYGLVVAPDLRRDRADLKLVDVDVVNCAAPRLEHQHPVIIITGSGSGGTCPCH